MVKMEEFYKAWDETFLKKNVYDRVVEVVKKRLGFEPSTIHVRRVFELWYNHWEPVDDMFYLEYEGMEEKMKSMSDDELLGVIEEFVRQTRTNPALCCE